MKTISIQLLIFCLTLSAAGQKHLTPADPLWKAIEGKNRQRTGQKHQRLAEK